MYVNVRQNFCQNRETFTKKKKPTICLMLQKDEKKNPQRLHVLK